MARIPTLKLATAALVGSTLTVGALAAGPGQDRVAAQSVARPAAAPPSSATMAKLPLAFEANGGRTDKRVDYIARGVGWSLFLTPREAVLSLGHGKRSDVLRTRLVGASTTSAEAERQLPGVINSIRGEDRSKWRTGIRSFARVRYPSVYPGTDLLYYGKAGTLEYDFVLAPGADPSRIAFDVSGASVVRIDSRGDLVMQTNAGPVRHHKPIAYQQIDGERRSVAARFVLDGERVRIRVGDYDRSKRLVIDPVLGYQFQSGGGGSDIGWSVAADDDGNAYIGATTGSAAFPGAGTRPGGNDGLVMKLSPSGTPVYTTYVGGSGSEELNGIAVGSDGSAYVVGRTESTNFPDERAPSNTNDEQVLEGSSDAYVARLNAAGNDLVWATYLGGSSSDEGNDLALDSTGDVHVVGQTASTDFFTSADRYQTDQASTDGFVTRLEDPGSGAIVREYSTYLGSAGGDNLSGVDVSATDQTYVVGSAGGDGYPTTHVTGNTRAGDTDIAYSRLDTTPSGATLAERQTNSLEFSRYIGGTLFDGGYGFALAHSPGGAGYIVGQTKSTTLPQAVTTAPFTHRPTGAVVDYDAFVIETAGVTVNQTIYLGGDNIEYGTDVAARTSATGSPMAYVVGTTASGGFPTENAMRTGTDGEYQMFALKWYPVASGGPELIWSTYLGGPGAQDFGEGIAADSQGRAYVTGRSGADFLVPPGNFAGGTYDVGVVRIDSRPPTITSGPADGATLTSGEAQFGLLAPETNRTLRCNAVDGTGHISATPTRTTCSVSKSYTGLADGTHVFEVIAQDDASDSSDPALARRTFKVDTTAPPAFDMTGPDDGATTGTLPTLSWQESADAVSSVSYRLMVDGQEVQTVESSACSGGTCSAQIASPLVTGAHTLRVRAVDAVGHTTDSASQRTITVKDPPTARLTINPNPALAGRTVTFDGSASADATHTISKYEWDLDGDGTFERNTDAVGTTTQSYATPKTINVSVRVTDSQGSPATVSQILRITAPGAAGTLLGVTINKGAQYTRTPNVTVSAVFPAGTTQMIISNDGGFLAGGTFGPQPDTKWKLDSSGPERLPKTIYVRFFTGPFPSETFQDDIILDETPPVVSQAAIASGARASTAELKDGSRLRLYVRAAARRKRSWKLRIRAKDSNSGVARVQVTSNKRKPGKLLRYKKRLTVKSATKPKWVRARDRAGNYSRWRKVR